MTGDRRRCPRRVPAPHEPIAHLRTRTGAELTALDISDGGARAHTVSWQRPGAKLEVHVLTRHGRVLHRARVLRVSVVALRPTVVTYDVALHFEPPIDSARRVEPTPTVAPVLPSEPPLPTPLDRRAVTDGADGQPDRP